MNFLSKNISIIAGFLIGIIIFFIFLISQPVSRINALSSKIISPLGKSFSVLSAQDHLYGGNTVYGFLPYWTLQNASYVQWDKITDFAYFSLHINKDGTIRRILEDNTTDPGYNVWRNKEELKEIIQKAKDENVRVALAIISHNDEISTEFLKCGDTCFQTLKDEIITELNYHNITDINLDFEYVGEVPKEIPDKYTKLTEYLNSELDKEFGDSKVVVATFADAFIKQKITKPQDLVKVVDGLFIMAYDFHVQTSDKAGPVSPISGRGVKVEYDIESMLGDYLSKVQANKIILGVAYYGYNWVVDSKEPYAQRLPGNEIIGFSQSQAYADIMETIIKYKPVVLIDPLAQTPYFNYISSQTGSIRQVHYENVDSLRIKYKLAKSLGLNGVGIWALGYDRGYQELWDLLETEFPRYIYE